MITKSFLYIESWWKNMSYLIAQPYIKVLREITSIEQKDVEHKRTLYLYPDKIVSAHREFPIEKVMDISFRKFGAEGGLLYIHTSSGLYTYIVRTSTDHLIEAFRRLKENP
jgi:hypothetical protein